jgi:hypothetical protein
VDSNRQVVREYWERASLRFKPPLTRAFKEVGDLYRFLTVVRSFLLEEVGLGSRQKAWRPFHESFRRFILDKLGVDRERALHSRLAEQLCQWPVAEAEGRFRWSYVLRHGVTHWLETEQWEQARKLYTDMGYLEKRCQEAGVLSVEEALKSVVQKAPERERGTARALLRAIQAGSHVLKGGRRRSRRMSTTGFVTGE